MKRYKILALSTICLTFLQTAEASTLVALTPDAANTSTPAFGSNLNSPLSDPLP